MIVSKELYTIMRTALLLPSILVYLHYHTRSLDNVDHCFFSSVKTRSYIQIHVSKLQYGFNRYSFLIFNFFFPSFKKCIENQSTSLYLFVLCVYRYLHFTSDRWDHVLSLDEKKFTCDSRSGRIWAQRPIGNHIYNRLSLSPGPCSVTFSLESLSLCHA
jgi:hypothetical protein